MGFVYVLLYLAAIIAANITVALWGPGMSVLNAFLFIGLDLTSRDSLHDLWRGQHLALKMLLLIFTGSLISYALNRSAGPIAVASFVSFMVSGVIDFTVYHLATKAGLSRSARVHTSNVFSAAADSIVFPAIAFGFPLMYGVMAGQFIAKTLGGVLWYAILRPRSSTDRAVVS